MFKKVIVLSMLLIGIVGTSHTWPFSSYSLFKKTQIQFADKIEKLEAET